MIRLYLWFCRVLFVARGPWVRWAPGLPCALFSFRGRNENNSSDAICAARMRGHAGHSGMVRSTRPQMRNCASGNLEIPGSMRNLSSGAHSRDPVASPRNDGRKFQSPLARNDGFCWSNVMRSVQHPLAVGAVERKGRHVDLEVFAGFADHLIAAGHNTRRGRKQDAGGIFETLAGREHRLFADHAFALDVLPQAGGVDDDPVRVCNCTVSLPLLVMTMV